ncbi:MAG: type II toxin-antitoxin system HicA family toxin [Dehalococcoidales bacterium]|nr:type II toxin-antitoxin system HicA family toxin [Dehalococcoidales bacterium]
MSPKLRILSGPEVIEILHSFGFITISQRGSHVKLRRLIESGEKQTLTVLNHVELDEGTLRAIIRQASRFIAEADLQPHFYSD